LSVSSSSFSQGRRRLQFAHEFKANPAAKAAFYLAANGPA
jgi:hypothetical protein